MGATNVVDAVNKVDLTPEQRAALLEFLQKRKDALQASIDEVDAAMKKLAAGPPPTPPTPP
jgi:hypothetical protein